MKEIKLEECQSLIGSANKLNAFNAKFLNGDMIIPSNEYGAFAICPGCGSGKTTIVKDLIKLRWYEGVLYSAFTRDEVNLMYKYIVDNLVGNCYHNGESLKIEDIVVLHSDYSSEGTDKNLWENNPKELLNKKIILCTHHKLLNEPIDLLLSYNYVYNPAYSKKMSVLCAIANSMPRQWILIDEGIEMNSYSRIIPKDALANLGEFRFEKYVEDNSLGYTRYLYVKVDEPILVRRDAYFSTFKENAELLRKFSNSSKCLLKEEKTELDKLRNEQILGEVYENFLFYANSNNDTSVKVSYGLHSLSVQNMKTHLLLLDGTSDITLKDSKKFKLLTFPNKYNGDISISIFPFNLKRSPKIDSSIVDPDSYIKDKIKSTIDSLENILKLNKKTLIFTWKNLKSRESEDINDEDSSDKEFVKSSNEVNSSKEFYNYISSELSNRGFMKDRDFSIEYYGSGRDKAINDYRDYDAVVLLGKYQVPDKVISEFNLAYDTTITSTEYYSNRVIQAICRTRIRKHEGLSLNIYMSSDWSNEVIRYVSKYLNTGVASTVIVDKKDSIDYMYSELINKGLTPSWSKKIATLSTYNRNIFDSIINEVQYSTEISLNEIFEILPMSEKKLRSYDSIVSKLSKLGIILNII